MGAAALGHAADHWRPEQILRDWSEERREDREVGLIGARMAEMASDVRKSGEETVCDGPASPGGEESATTGAIDRWASPRRYIYI